MEAKRAINFVEHRENFFSLLRCSSCLLIEHEISVFCQVKLCRLKIIHRQPGARWKHAFLVQAAQAGVRFDGKHGEFIRTKEVAKAKRLAWDLHRENLLEEKENAFSPTALCHRDN